MKTIFTKLSKYEFLFSISSLIVTFFADILQPIYPVIFFLFILSAIILFGILAIKYFYPNFKYNTKWALVFSSSLFILTGIFSYFNQTEASQEKGILASNGFEIAEILQNSLGIIQNDLDSIKETIEKVEKNTEKNIQETKKVVEAIQETTKRVVSSINKIQKNFSELNQSGGIINNPSTPEQFYHNARIYELNGDYGNARRSYNKYLSFKLDFLDPHLRYQTFLKIQEGKAGAREIYNAIYENDARPIVEFSRILLYESPRRTEMLKAFVKKNPEFGPALFELSKEYSLERKGEQTRSDKKSELNYLKKFLESLNSGFFIKYFVDKEFASNIISESEKKLLSLEKDKTLSSPVLVTMKYNTKQNTVKLCYEVYRWVERENCYGEKTKQETRLSNFWELNIQIFENSSSPIVSLRNNNKNGDKNLIIDNLKKSINLTEFSTYLKPLELRENSAIFVSYLDSENEKQGPFEIKLDKGSYYLEFVDKLIGQNINPLLPLSDNQIKMFPGNPYNHIIEKLGIWEEGVINIPHIIAAANDIPTYQRLLDRGVDVNGVMKRNLDRGCIKTPLMIASNHGNTEMVKFLLENGANMNFSSRAGNALDIAKYRKFSEIKDLLKKTVNIPCRCGTKNSEECRKDHCDRPKTEDKGLNERNESFCKSGGVMGSRLPNPGTPILKRN